MVRCEERERERERERAPKLLELFILFYILIEAK